MTDIGKPERATQNRVVSHNARFVSVMNLFMPKWQHYRDELNHLPVRHEDWDY